MPKHSPKRRKGGAKTKSEFFKLGKPNKPSFGSDGSRPSRGGTR